MEGNWCRQTELAICGFGRERRTLARALTVIETAKMNGLEPQAYLADVLDRIHDHMNTRLGELLPWNWVPRGTVKTEAA
jgi:transposase